MSTDLDRFVYTGWTTLSAPDRTGVLWSEFDDTTLNKFNPNQPRDDQGRFAGGGGSGTVSFLDLEEQLPENEYGRRSGVKDLGEVSVTAYRVGNLEDKSGRGGTFFGGSPEDVESYMDLHAGEEVKSYTIDLENAVLAGHQDDLTKAWFKKPYGTMMDSFHHRYADASKATAAFDKKLLSEAKKRGYDGVILVAPAPPAKHEVAIIKKGVAVENSNLADTLALNRTYKRDNKGRFTSGGSGGGGGGASRSERAKSTHKPSTKEKQQRALEEQKRLAKLVGGENIDDNKPFDVELGSVGVEVKTVMDNNNDKITMHPKSRKRKEAEAKRRGLTAHTVVIDVRGGRRKYYHKEGVGAYRLKSMNRVSAKKLREILS